MRGSADLTPCHTLRLTRQGQQQIAVEVCCLRLYVCVVQAQLGGLSGKIRFAKRRRRESFSLDLMELTIDGLEKVRVTSHVANESVPKIIINTGIDFFNCNQHFGKFEP